MRGLTIAAAVVLFVTQARAGIITQTTYFMEEGGDFTPGQYNQLNPSLAPLNIVGFALSFSGVAATYAVTNTTGNQISFNVSYYVIADTDAGTYFSATYIVPITLGPYDIYYLSASVGEWDVSGTQTTNLSGYVGTGMLDAMPIFGASAGADNPSIDVQTEYHGEDISGSETITYGYGDTFTIPEPVSLAMLSLGLAAVAVVAWRRRAAA